MDTVPFPLVPNVSWEEQAAKFWQALSEERKESEKLRATIKELRVELLGSDLEALEQAGRRAEQWKRLLTDLHRLKDEAARTAKQRDHVALCLIELHEATQTAIQGFTSDSQFYSLLRLLTKFGEVVAILKDHQRAGKIARF